MATSVFSADRRKKVVTYGKSSRLPTVPTPRPSSIEDAPSPERPRKHTSTLGGSLKKPGGTLKSVGILASGGVRTGSPDRFDIPSDDDFVIRPIKPANRPPVKPRSPEYDFDIPDSDNEAPITNRQLVKAIPMSRPPKPTGTTSSAVQKLRKPAPPLKLVSAPPLSFENVNTPRMQRGKTPQPTQKAVQITANKGLEQQPKIEAKSLSRPIAPAQAVPKPKPSNVLQAVAIPISKRTLPAQQAKKQGNLDVFDVPVSDDEIPSAAQRSTNGPLFKKSKKGAKAIISTAGFPQNDTAESEDSNTSRTRKRKGSFSSVTTVVTAKDAPRESSVPQRNRKYQKKEDSVSPVQFAPRQATSASEFDPQPNLVALNKPKRTRVRTVPVLEKPRITKGQSSPAILSSMLLSRQTTKPSPIRETVETTIFGGDTMYDIPDSVTTPLRSGTNATPGSVTPRQKALFNSLLGDASSSSTPMPRIAALQLTDRKPKSLIGTLSKSKSDLTHATPGRKTRLIDTIKRTETSSADEEEDEDSESESESESSEDLEERSKVRQLEKEPQRTNTTGEVPSDSMDVDVEVPANSQRSQTTSGFGTRSKLTYAKSRSYLEEATFEDALLVSMDLDDNLGLDSQKNTATEDEYDPMSQVQARHELKRRGQQTAFHWETETLINDITGKTSTSVRRSTMIELCTKMASETFTSQLLDSPLAHEFFKNISSNGEVIYDFAAIVAIVCILKIDPTSTVLHQILDIGIINTLIQLASNDVDIRRIARDRRTNLSKIGQESVEKLRTLVQTSSVWTSMKPEKVSPQLVALKALELLILHLRRTGTASLLIDEENLEKLVSITTNPSERLKSGKGQMQDTLVLNLVLSTLEAASVAQQKHPSWPIRILQGLANLLPVFIQPDTASSTVLAVKLCMNLTNNRPKACQPFSGIDFVQPLMSFITHNFTLLGSELIQDKRIEALESLILSLGAMINLAELSDEARVNVDDGKQMIATLVKIFLDGSERAAQADTMEESHSSVAVGYLAVLLGNLCLNKSVKSKIRAELPGQRLSTLVDKIKEFVKFHERVDSKSKQFDGDEGREAWQNYTTRLLLVVKKLEHRDA